MARAAVGFQESSLIPGAWILLECGGGSVGGRGNVTRVRSLLCSVWERAGIILTSVGPAGGWCSSSGAAPTARRSVGGVQLRDAGAARSYASPGRMVAWRVASVHAALIAGRVPFGTGRVARVAA